MSEFQALVQSLIHDLLSPDLEPFRERAQNLKERNSPRRRFERWRNSEAGQSWKQQAFEQVGGQCCGCQHSFPHVSHLVIDHIQPIAKAPELATVVSNFQLLCFACNQKKGVQLDPQ